MRLTNEHDEALNPSQGTCAARYNKFFFVARDPTGPGIDFILSMNESGTGLETNMEGEPDSRSQT